MLCEKILGTLADFPGKSIDYVTIEWYETGKKLHRKTSLGGVDIAIRLDDEAALPFKQNDVLCSSGDTVFAVDIPAFPVLVICVAHHHMAAKVAWEIGNKHAPLFWGEEDGEFITPYDAPIETLLRKLPDISVEKQIRIVDFSKEISGGGHSHDHAHHEHHEHHHDHEGHCEHHHDHHHSL
jgi:urease accessory protein